MKLVIAEKPSVAANIAKVIGANNREDGFFSGNGYLVTWCVGHLISLAPPNAYDPELVSWDLKYLPILPDPFQTVVNTSTKSQYLAVKALMQRPDVTELVCATDAGREGELIFRLVYQQAKCQKPFSRLWISSMEDKAIRDGMTSLQPGVHYQNLYAAAVCRQQADWLVGINLTRMYSRMYNHKLNTGRVQTPTLNLVVKRQQEIDSFIPKPYFRLVSNFGEFKAFCIVEEESQADFIQKQCQGKPGIVTSLIRQEKRENPPALYDLTSLQADSNRLFGYSLQKTLDIIQALYDAKLATYPRTDSRFLTDDMEDSTAELLQHFLASDILAPGVTENYDTSCIDIKKVINGQKVSDHHALLPTLNVTAQSLANLDQEEQQILFLLIYQLLAAVYLPYQYASTKAELTVEDIVFTATGKEVLFHGFQYLVKKMRESLQIKEGVKHADEMLPELAEGQTFLVQEIQKEAKKTQPPKPYTDETLVRAMENAGKLIEDEALREKMKSCRLATPSTQASIVESLIANGYVIRNKKYLLPTPTAFQYMEIVTDVVKEPDLTASWEEQLAEIAEGRKNPEDFLQGIRTFLKEFIEASKRDYNPEKAAEIFPDTRAIGVCPKCGKPVLELPKSFTCSSGKDCGFVIWKQIARKEISRPHAESLLAQKRSDLIKGFSNKEGKEFDAYLVIKPDFSIGFAFPDKPKGNRKSNRSSQSSGLYQPIRR